MLRIPLPEDDGFALAKHVKFNTMNTKMRCSGALAGCSEFRVQGLGLKNSKFIIGLRFALANN